MGRGERLASISVVIATYNRADCIAATLDGLLAQTYRHFEVIIVVGPCTDDTLEVVEAYPRARILRCPEARLGLARNIGINVAGGEILAFIDDDAVPRETWLAQLAAAYANPGVGAAGGYVWDAVNDCMQWRVCACSRTGKPQTDAPPPLDAYQGPGADPFIYLAGCNMSLRRDLVEELGGFNEALVSVYEDVDMFRRVVDGGRLVTVLPAALVDHGVAPNESRDAKRNLRDTYRVVHDYAVYLGHNPPPNTDRGDLQRLVGEFAETYRANVRWQVGQGTMSAAEGEHFLGRIAEGEAQGIKDGTTPRTIKRFAASEIREFKAFGPKAQ